jgi:hypothetical protein
LNEVDVQDSACAVRIHKATAEDKPSSEDAQLTYIVIMNANVKGSTHTSIIQWIKTQKEKNAMR